MSCGVGCRGGLDPAFLWLWLGPAATVPIRLLAWEPLYATGAAQERAKKKKKKKKKKRKLTEHGKPAIMEKNKNHYIKNKNKKDKYHMILLT